MSVVKWSEEADAVLKDRRSRGYSFRETATEVNARCGTDFSRNACIGRAKRLGLSVSEDELAWRRLRAAAQRKQDIKNVAPGKRGGRRFRIVPDLSGGPVGAISLPNLEPDASALRCVEIEPKHLSIMELTEDSCRWPCGGWPESTPVTFCGHFALFGPYCDAHTELSRGQGSRGEQCAHVVSNRSIA